MELHYGELSEWLGRALQKHLHWFESNIHLPGEGYWVSPGGSWERRFDSSYGDCRLMVGQMFVVHSIRVRFSSITPIIAWLSGKELSLIRKAK